MQRSTKQKIKKYTPAFLLSLKRAILNRPRRTVETPEQKALRIRHETINQGLGAGEIAIREGLVVKIYPGTRFSFEHFCYYAPEMVQELNAFLECARSRRNFLDIGALHGIFSLAFAAANPDKKAIAVDASPVAFSQLLYHVHKNQLANITPVESALSAEPGVLRMHYEFEHAVAAGTTEDDTNLLSVEKTTGDDLCASLNFEPDIIKIDVEGHEVKVLQGLKQTLQRNRPLLFLEVHATRIEEEGNTLEELVQLLAPLGYQAKRVDNEPTSLEAITRLQSDERLILSVDSGA